MSLFIRAISIQQYEIKKNTFYEFDFDVLDHTGQDEVVYSALKSKPSSRKINVLIIPWTTLISRQKLSLIEEVVPQWSGETVTVCVHEYYRNILPLLQRLKVTHLFVTQAKRGERWSNIRILQMPYYPKCIALPAHKKDILYSFVGYNSHPFRSKLFAFARGKIRNASTVFIKERTEWGFHHIEDKLGIEYRDIISRSRFGLCPRGASPNTMRLFELMGAGAIPVVLADALYLPPGIDWHKCVIRLGEAQLNKVDVIIRSISLEREQAMRKKCLRAYQMFIEDPAYFVRYAIEQ